VLYRLAVAVGAVAIVRRLRALFDSFAANQPFAAGNADHLRRIWVTLVVIEIIRTCAFVAARLLPTFYAAGDVSPLPDEIASPVDLSRWFMILTALSEKVGLAIANLSILKTGKARAIRFSTLDALCRELRCQPGDILVFDPSGVERDGDGRE
jgi:putative transcriptional regulator